MLAQSPERCRRLFAADAPSLPPELLAEEAARERWLARAEAECLAAAKAEAEAEAEAPASTRRCSSLRRRRRWPSFERRAWRRRERDCSNI